jgi:hypothetical protein
MNMENEHTDFNFDLERMKEAVESQTISIPVAALENFEAFDDWLNSEENGYSKLRDRLPNPFAVDYQHESGPLDIYTEVEMMKFAGSIIKEAVKVLDDYSESLDCGTDYKNGYSHGFEWAINVLEDHFGVK